MLRTTRAILSLLTGVMGSMVALFLGVLSTPFLLRWLGDDRVGAYRIALEWVGYLALLDFGITAALQTIVALRLGKGEHTQALLDVKKGMRRFVLVAVMQFGIALILSVSFGYLIRGLSKEIAHELRWGVVLASVGFIWLPLNAIRPLLDASQQGYWVNIALLAQSIGSILLAMLFAWCGYGLVGQFASTLVGGVFYTLVLCIVVIRAYPQLASLNGSGAPDALKVAWPMFAFNVLGRVSVLSDSIIVGAFLGPTEVVKYYLTQRFLLLAVSQVMSLGNSTWAPLTEIYHRGQVELFRTRFAQINRWTAILSVAALGPIAVLNRQIIGSWVGPDRFGGEILTWFTLGQGYLMAILAFWLWPIVGIGKVQSAIPVLIVGSALNVTISIYATLQFGIIGASLGTFLSYLFVYSFAYARLLKREFGLSRTELMLEPTKAALLFLPLGVVLSYVSPHLHFDTISSHRIVHLFLWVLSAGLTGLVYLFLAWKFLIQQDERKVWEVRVCQAFPRIQRRAN